jgi:hypothetical protein
MVQIDESAQQKEVYLSLLNDDDERRKKKWRQQHSSRQEDDHHLLEQLTQEQKAGLVPSLDFRMSSSLFTTAMLKQ